MSFRRLAAVLLGLITLGPGCGASETAGGTGTGGVSPTTGGGAGPAGSGGAPTGGVGMGGTTGGTATGGTTTGGASTGGAVTGGTASGGAS